MERKRPLRRKENNEPATKESRHRKRNRKPLFSPTWRENPRRDAEPAEESRPKRNKIFLVGALAVACVVLAAVPRTRQSLRIVYRNAVRAGGNWLNPQPVPVPQTVTQHETFGQEGDEYKLPVAANIPDATTDPSQIRVLPVIDPTAKPTKGSDAAARKRLQARTAPTDQNQSGSSENRQAQTAGVQCKEQTTTTGNAAGGADGSASPGAVSSAVQAQPNPPCHSGAAAQQKPRPIAQPVQISAPPHAVSAGSSSAIPSSLRSQIASMTPEASGAKPVESAMSSIEPVNLPESAAWDLLAQPVDPVYPDAAKAGGQRGSVVLQVLIGRDGTVQDAKFMQGSLVFARAAIEAVKQWRFKPYSLNGRAVSVQSSITLNFKPPA